jgi:oligopeptide/dipeptide ABC transporter ATP-binding protein
VDESLAKVDSGQAVFRGRDLLKLSEKELKSIRGREISYIFQNSSAALSPYKKIGKQLEEVLKTHGLPQSKEHILKTLEEVGLEDGERIYDMYPFQLSGGQNQRIMIAQCIICSPNLLIADEPTSSIDASLQKTILDLLRDIATRNRMSVIIITHDFGVARYLCDRLMVMYGGLVLEEGTIDDILSSPLHPYTKELIRCAQSLARDDNTMYTIEGSPPTPDQFREECPFYSRCKLREDACLDGIPERIHVDGRKVRCIKYEKR